MKRLLKTCCLLLALCHPLQAAVKFTAFNTTTGAATTTVAVTGVGFLPTGAVLWWNGRVDTVDAIGAGDYLMGQGFVAGATNRRAFGIFGDHNNTTSVTNSCQRNDAVVCTTTDADAIDGLLDLQSFDSDGATFIIDDAFSVSVRVQVLFFNGASATTGTYALPDLTGNHSITGLSFQPQLVLFGTVSNATANTVQAILGMLGVGAASGSSNRYATTFFDDDGEGTAIVTSYGISSNCIAGVFSPNVSYREDFVSMNSDGFTVNTLETGGFDELIHYMAIGGLSNVTVTNVTTKTDMTDIVISGLGWAPEGGLIASVGEPASTSDTVNPGTSNEFAMQLGGFNSATSRGGLGIASKNAAAITVNATIIETDEVYAKILSGATIHALMDVKSMDSGGVTFVMDDTDSPASFVGVVLLKTSSDNATVPTYMRRRRQ